MLKNLQETIKALNADAKNVANCEKAKKLRKKLLAIGLPMAIGGFLGIVVYFACVTFLDADFGLSISLPISFVCLVVAAIGLCFSILGFEIAITGYTTNMIDETVGNNCPKCGETISSEMNFCSKCGAKIRKECSNCKHINEHKSDYCEKCGAKLE